MLTTCVANDDLEGMTTLIALQKDQQSVNDIIKHIDTHHSDFTLPLCISLQQSSQCVDLCSFLGNSFDKSVIQMAENITGGDQNNKFKIKSNTTGQCLQIKEEINKGGKVSRWSTVLNRFTNTNRIGKNYYVFSTSD